MDYASCMPCNAARPAYRAAVAQLFLDPQQLVVLGGAVGPREAAGLDLAAADSATARSAMVESSVSPDRCDMTAV